MRIKSACRWTAIEDSEKGTGGRKWRLERERGWKRKQEEEDGGRIGIDISAK